MLRVYPLSGSREDDGCVVAFGTTGCYDQSAEALPTDVPPTAQASATPTAPLTGTSTATSEPATSTATPTQNPDVHRNAAACRSNETLARSRQIADGLNSPVFATHAGDGSGRLFVVEKKAKFGCSTPMACSSSPLGYPQTGRQRPAANRACLAWPFIQTSARTAGCSSTTRINETIR